MIENTSKSPPPFIIPGSIEASEARGQTQLVASTLLPSKMNGQKHLFERMGFRFGEVVQDDPMFIYAELPRGWEKRATDHSMRSEIVDERGTRRARIFYKAAFYDRRADMSLVGRYEIDANWGADGYATKETEVAKVIDQKTGVVLYEVIGRRITNDRGHTSPACANADDLARAWCRSNLPQDWIEAWFQD